MARISSLQKREPSKMASGLSMFARMPNSPPSRASHRSERSINFSSRIGTAVSPSTRGVAEEIAAAELDAVVAAAPRGRLIDERFDCG
jgi:hypothetical protein